MSYERDKMLAGITETPWREMDRFADRVARYFNDHPSKDSTVMSYALVSAAEDELHEDARKKREAQEAKADAAKLAEVQS